MSRTTTRRLTAPLALTAAVALLAGACSVDQGTAADPAPADRDEKLTVGFVNGNNIEFHTCLLRSMQARAEQDNVELLTANSAMDPAKELSNIDDMIAKQVDVIIVQTVNMDALEGGITRANRANIPIFLTSVASVDQSKILGAVVTDVTGVGRQLGEWLGKDSAGQPVEVGVIGGAPGAAADLMDAAFKKALPEQAEVVFDQPAFWQRAKAQDVAENLLQASPDVQYIFVHNEDMAIGVLAALKAADRHDIKVVTNGGSPEGIEGIRNDEIAATVSNTPRSVGEMAIDNVVGLMRQEEGVQKISTVPNLLITKTNVGEAPPYCA
ncbi:sugar ABC transporter substrate-binding protein [Streptomyces sp. NPDC093252]|uniref:sugar ABC transporter substrate-binding protein n=1 Tax=Streptomyces sp. NPDC093252 TaxID=3154980 RepID=UPI00341EA066